MLRKMIIPLATVAALGLGSMTTALAEDHDHLIQDKADIAARMNDNQTASAALKYNLDQAIQKAEQATGGKALSAKTDGMDKSLYRIVIRKGGKDESVTVNGMTGKVEVMTASAGTSWPNRAGEERHEK